MNPGCHHQGLPLHTTSPSSQPVSFPQGVPHNVLSPAHPNTPHTALPQAQHGVHHTLPLPVQQGTLPYLESQPISGTTLHHQPDQGPGISTVPQSSTSSLTITQLEQRLGEAMEKKLESMTKAFRSSMSPTLETPPAALPTMQDRALDSRLQQTLEVHSHQDPRGSTVAMLTSKAKPPTRPEEATSRRRSTFRRSRSHSGRKPLPRHRAHSHQAHSEEHTAPTSRSYTPPGHREHLAHHDRPGRRDEVPDRASMPTSRGERNLSHPIYQRSNAIRARSSNADSWHQIHADANTTVFARSSGESHHRESRHRQDRPASSITLRSRSRSRGGRAPPKSPLYKSWKRSQVFTYIHVLIITLGQQDTLCPIGNHPNLKQNQPKLLFLLQMQ